MSLLFSDKKLCCSADPPPFSDNVQRKQRKKAAQNGRLEVVEDLLEGSDTEQRIDIGAM